MRPEKVLEFEEVTDILEKLQQLKLGIWEVGGYGRKQRGGYERKV